MPESSQPAFSRPPLPELPDGETSILIRTPLPTPAYPDSSALSFTVYARTPIAAPATTVVRALLDPTTWPRWNNFIPATTIHSLGTPVPSLSGAADLLGVGAKFTMCVNMSGKPEAERGPVEKMRQSPTFVSVVEELVPQREEGRRGWRVIWRADGGQQWMLNGERLQEVVETEEGCEYITWESFGGWMAPVVRLAVGGALIERFGDWGRDLKGWCEGEGKGE
jgi:hypothetical protein